MTPDPNLTKTTPVDADRFTAWDRIRELQQTCRVLTELAQQLTNAVAVVPASQPKPVYQELAAALDAAAELGITPKP